MKTRLAFEGFKRWLLSVWILSWQDTFSNSFKWEKKHNFLPTRHFLKYRIPDEVKYKIHNPGIQHLDGKCAQVTVGHSDQDLSDMLTSTTLLFLHFFPSWYVCFHQTFVFSLCFKESGTGITSYRNTSNNTFYLLKFFFWNKFHLQLWCTTCKLDSF